MSLSAAVFGRDSAVFKVVNILGAGGPGLLDKWFGAGPPEPMRLGEISQQTAKEAEPRVIVWGRVRPIGGNLIQSQQPRRWWSKEKTGGKGGGSKTQKVEHVSRTYAIGVCEGPITEYRRIWRNSKLVYDARGNEWGEKNNPVFLNKFRLYTGQWDQMPDPKLESIWGVGQVPAYRGTAYMVAVDEELTDLGGAVPQWQFEVARYEDAPEPQPSDIINVNSSITSNTGVGVTIGRPGGTTEGDRLVAIVLSTTNATAPSGWELEFSNTTSPSQYKIFSKVAGSSEPTSYQFLLFGEEGSIVVCVSVYRATAGVTIDHIGEFLYTPTNSQPLTALSITPPNDGLLLGVWGFNSADLFSFEIDGPPDGMFTLRQRQQGSLAMYLAGAALDGATASGDKGVYAMNYGSGSAMLIQLH